MSIETRNRDGRLVAVQHRPARGAPLGRLLAGAGLLLVLAPATALPGAGAGVFFEILAGQLLLLAAAGKLLAESSRRNVVRTSLHVATGEVEVKAGRGPLSRTLAFGAVEVDRLLLARCGRADRPRYDLLLVPHSGGPVRIVTAEPDGAAALDLALVLSQGMNVAFEDRRLPAPDPAGGQTPPPARVAGSGEGARRVYTWDYRDRFRPEASLAALGGGAALAVVLPALSRQVGSLVVVPLLLLLGVALAVAGHAVRSLTIRRVVLRPDAVRVERQFASLSLVARLVLYSELKAVLLLPRGPVATVSLRAGSGARGVALPLEDPPVAAWLRHTIQRAAHDAGRRVNPLGG
jgi:hypothetical protein